MTEEIMIVDQVQVDVEQLREFANHAAIPATVPLTARFETTSDAGTGRHWERPVYGFTADGFPLVLNEEGTRLSGTWENPKPGHRFLGLEPARPALAGPFTPAPAGMTAVFSTGQRARVVFYDLHGRAVLMGEDTHRELYLAEDDEDLVRIEGGPQAADDTT